MRFLNIGCGINPTKIKGEDWTNIDPNPQVEGVDYGVLPFLKFKANTFEYAFCHHVLEHTKSSLKENLEDIYRVLTPNGILEAHVPHFAFHGAICHPEHVRYFDIHTFMHFTPKVLDDPQANLYPKPNCRFELVSCEYRYRETDHTNTKLNPLKMLLIRPINWVANHHRDFFDRMFCYWVGGCEEIVVKMRAIK